jgi:general secretion pathway protein A
MYKDFFRLNEKPFSISPDPRFLFMSERHREATAHLLYGMQGEGGIVLLTGEVGTGKTTVCRKMIEQIPENIDVAFILNPRMSAGELLQTICQEYHIPIKYKRSGIKVYVDTLNERLLAGHAEGRRAIVIIDEAQNLETEVLEQLRLLTNLETNTRKLLQIFLIGQPELQTLLDRTEMRQVSQRVIARYHLTKLGKHELSAYIAHRLQVAGLPPASPPIFPDKLMNHLYKASGGVPRLINLICDRALLGAYVKGQPQVTLPVLKQAAKEVLAVNPRQKGQRNTVAVLLLTVVVLGGLLITQLTASQFGWTGSWFANTSDKVESAAARKSGAASVAASPVVGPVQWPEGMSRTDSDAIAFQSLFKLYRLAPDAESGIASCAVAEVQGMRCYNGQGGLFDLFLLDQPALLKLASPNGRQYSATLKNLDLKTATLIIGTTEQRVSLTDLATAWYGQFIALWNSPPNYNGKLVLNQHSSVVRWLREEMKLVDGIPDDGSDVFDEELARRVRVFQLANGIQPDGQVGPLTLIRLNVHNGKGGPSLAVDERG